MIVTEDGSAGAVEEVEGFVVDMGDFPQMKSKKSTMHRLLTATWPARDRTAWRRGPCPPVGTPAGNGGHVERPQAGRPSRCSWYSVTSGRIVGNSSTW